MNDLLRTIDLSDLDWHAKRYDSARAFQDLVRNAHFLQLSENEILPEVQHIAELCIEDGADYGTIPCLGGQALTVWNELFSEVEEANGITEFFGEGYKVRSW